MEIIFGRNKKEQLEPLRATVTGETSVFRWASFSFPVLEVVYGSLDPIYGNKMRQDPETVSVNKWGMFAHGNSVSKGRAITSQVSPEECWERSDREPRCKWGDQRITCRSWFFPPCPSQGLNPGCWAWLQTSLPAMPSHWPLGGVFQGIALEVVGNLFSFCVYFLRFNPQLCVCMHIH